MFISPPQTAVSKYEATKQKRKFSSFFKSLVIELDKDLYGPDNHLVEVRGRKVHFSTVVLTTRSYLLSLLCQLSVIEVSLSWFQWHRTATTQETDGFQVKRPGDVGVRCTVLLMLDYQVMTNTYCVLSMLFQTYPCWSWETTSRWCQPTFINVSTGWYFL